MPASTGEEMHRAPTKSIRAPLGSVDPATSSTGMHYRPLADYALIGDCHSAALLSRDGSIDWCCLPRFDSDSCFGRLLDRNRGGHFSITAAGSRVVDRAYVPDSLVVSSTFETSTGAAQLIDFFAMRRGGRTHPRRLLVRMVRGLRGTVRFRAEFTPRLDFGEVKPWIHAIGRNAWCAVGSNTALVLAGDVPLQLAQDHGLCGDFDVVVGQQRHLTMQFVPPSELDRTPQRAHALADPPAHLAETLDWWHDWTSKVVCPGGHDPALVRSAITLTALSFAPTGAVIAAPTTSLPEVPGGERNGDYRYSWIRDSVFTVRALASLGCEAEADGFRRFIQRSAAGHADELQVMYAVDGKRRLTEVTLDRLEGWCGSRPVRVGNDAYCAFQRSWTPVSA